MRRWRYMRNARGAYFLQALYGDRQIDRGEKKGLAGGGSKEVDKSTRVTSAINNFFKNRDATSCEEIASGFFGKNRNVDIVDRFPEIALAGFRINDGLHGRHGFFTKLLLEKFFKIYESGGKCDSGVANVCYFIYYLCGQNPIQEGRPVESGLDVSRMVGCASLSSGDFDEYPDFRVSNGDDRAKNDFSDSRRKRFRSLHESHFYFGGASDPLCDLRSSRVLDSYPECVTLDNMRAVLDKAEAVTKANKEGDGVTSRGLTAKQEKWLLGLHRIYKTVDSPSSVVDVLTSELLFLYVAAFNPDIEKCSYDKEFLTPAVAQAACDAFFNSVCVCTTASSDYDPAAAFVQPSFVPGSDEMAKSFYMICRIINVGRGDFANRYLNLLSGVSHTNAIVVCAISVAMASCGVDAILSCCKLNDVVGIKKLAATSSCEGIYASCKSGGVMSDSFARLYAIGAYLERIKGDDSLVQDAIIDIVKNELDLLVGDANRDEKIKAFRDLFGAVVKHIVQDGSKIRKIQNAMIELGVEHEIMACGLDESTVDSPFAKEEISGMLIKGQREVDGEAPATSIKPLTDRQRCVLECKEGKPYSVEYLNILFGELKGNGVSVLPVLVFQRSAKALETQDPALLDVSEGKLILAHAVSEVRGAIVKELECNGSALEQFQIIIPFFDQDTQSCTAVIFERDRMGLFRVSYFDVSNSNNVVPAYIADTIRAAIPELGQTEFSNYTNYGNKYGKVEKCDQSAVLFTMAEGYIKGLISKNGENIVCKGGGNIGAGFMSEIAPQSREYHANPNLAKGLFEDRFARYMSSALRPGRPGLQDSCSTAADQR